MAPSIHDMTVREPTGYGSSVFEMKSEIWVNKIERSQMFTKTKTITVPLNDSFSALVIVINNAQL